MEGLSRYLGDLIDELDENLTAQELADALSEREELLKSVETLFGNTAQTAFTGYHDLRRFAGRYPVPAKVMSTHHDILEYQVDEALTRLLIAEIPRMVMRALQLEPALSEESSNRDDNAYLREATRCYLCGLFNASVSLSRSALELSFSGVVPKLLQGAADSLENLICVARKSVLKRSPKVCDRADDVRRKANKIVHGKTCSEREALSVLRETRAILICLGGTSNA